MNNLQKAINRLTEIAKRKEQELDALTDRSAIDFKNGEISGLRNAATILQMFQEIKGPTFTRVFNARSNGISRQGDLPISPAKLTEILGRPDFPESFDGKVAMEWSFRDENGNAITIWPYKATNDYDPELPSKEDFLKSTKIFEFSIAAKKNAHAESFVNWLESTYEIKGRSW